MSPNRLALSSWLFAATFAFSCGAAIDQVYAPDRASAWLDGYPAVVRPLPPERPQGELRLASFGVTELAPADQPAVVVLHVRFVVTNEGDATAWTLDTREQLIELAGEGRSAALFVNTDRDQLPVVAIGPRERRTLDFYFPLPAQVRSDDALPGFEILWRIGTADRAVADRTAFRRVETEPRPATEVILVTGWGPYWWHDPLLHPIRFIHPPVIVVRPPVTRVHIRRPPSRHRWVVRDHRR
jgi:hypothetical protein